MTKVTVEMVKKANRILIAERPTHKSSGQMGYHVNDRFIPVSREQLSQAYKTACEKFNKR